MTIILILFGVSVGIAIFCYIKCAGYIGKSRHSTCTNKAAIHLVIIAFIYVVGFILIMVIMMAFVIGGHGVPIERFSIFSFAFLIIVPILGMILIKNGISSCEKMFRAQ